MQRRVILEQRRAEAEAQAALAAAAVSEVGEVNDQNMEGQKESNAGTAQVDAVEGKNATAKGKDAEYRALLTSTNS
ncbi:hypothetical protein WR25_22341 [Diploscapter pachys]|uniref:Uncharacterized protein n=1 Tax=Diploscapter pachys TaxID=2018661 RepID=A0A2A2M4A3_9BILA|nr:hypothetical protein WR25_22341 [Diploscapter pachys]